MSTITRSAPGHDETGLPTGHGVVLVDDHAVFAEALAGALRAEPDFGEIRTAPDAATAVRLLAGGDTALVVIDVRLGDQDGLTLLGMLRALSPGTRAVMLTGHLQRDVVVRARALGAYAALPKGTSLGTLLASLRRVMAGERLYEPATESALAEGLLTARETEVLQLLANGSDPRQVARRLGLSAHTVRDYVKSAREKLGVRTQLAAVVAAAGLGIVELPVNQR